MSVDYAALYADHDAMANHWWWRPGWQVGTRFYAWHITQDDHPEVAQLVERYQAALADVPTLDPVPPQWQHMTLQGVGHVEDITDDDAARVIDAVAHRLAGFPAISTTYQRAHIFREAIALPPSDPEAFTALRDAIRNGIKDALGDVSETREGFRAHVSVAYSNGEANAASIRKALDAVQPDAPVMAQYGQVSLIRMHRDHRMYQWNTTRTVMLGVPREFDDTP